MFWKVSAHSFYVNSMDDFCFKFILFLSYEDVKMCRYISSSLTKNAEVFTCNNFLKCRQLKKLNCVILLSYEHEKDVD